MKKILLLTVTVLVLMNIQNVAQISAIATGNWSDINTWGGGVIPKATDNVVIVAGNTVTIDTDNAVCNDLLIDGTLTFPDVADRSITVNGALLIGATGNFNTYSTGSPTALRNQKIFLMGDLTVTNGGKIDMRRGSNPNVGIGLVEFGGSKDSKINLSQTKYGSSIEEFNGININKTGGAKVILQSGNLFMSNNTSTGPTFLTFISGKIVTEGTSVWGYMTTNTTGIIGASSTSYVIGKLGRGFSNSASAKREFPVGDSDSYRPVVVKSTTAQGATGAMVIVEAISGNANKNSKFAGDIDKVSEVRYYSATYARGASGAASLSIDTLGVGYGTDDGVKAGNINLRAAYSTDERANWKAIPQATPYVTTLDGEPNIVYGDALNPVHELTDGSTIYLALARVSGTKENSLTKTGTSVEDVNQLPSDYSLSQNFPNPFNPTTNILYSIPKEGFVKIVLYSITGEKIQTLVNENKQAGVYQLSFDGSKLNSGVYLYQITSNGFAQTKKMTLIK